MQVSRFHAETLEGVVGADLDIRGLTVGVASTGKCDVRVTSACACTCACLRATHMHGQVRRCLVQV